MKTILVTGGAGYIGSHTVRELVSQNYQVVVLDSLENGKKEAVDKKAKFVKADLKNKKAVDAIFQKYQPEAVIDFAAYLKVGESMTNPRIYLENNVFNFVNLLDAMVENNCFLIIKSSTASVYGDPQKTSDFPLQETYTKKLKPKKSALLEGEWNGKKLVGEKFFQIFIKKYQAKYQNRKELLLNKTDLTQLRIPSSIYGLSKALDEVIMEKFEKNHQIKSIALRYFNVAGASFDTKIGDNKPKPTNLMTVTIKAILEKGTLTVFGNNYKTKDGTGVRDYIHVVDLAKGHLKALAYLEKTKKSAIFNLGTGKGSTVLEVIKEVEKASGKKVNFVIGPRRSGDPEASYCDPKKANQILNWRTQHNLKEMAKTAWRWEKKIKKLKK